MAHPPETGGLGVAGRLRTAIWTSAFMLLRVQLVIVAYEDGLVGN